MKKNLFMTAAAIAALLTGCSTDEEIANIETSAKNAIGFNIVSNKAETKATPIRPGNLTTTDFDVFAFNSSTGDLFMGTHQGTFGHDGVDIVYKKEDGKEVGKWDYKNPNDLAYWPTNSLDFYAVSPATVDVNLFGFLTWLIHSDEQKIKYSTGDEFSNKNNPKNIDVMYAVAKNQTKDTNHGVVQLKFKHTLSQVLFNAKVQYKSMKVTIKNMEIKCFYTGGTFTIPADGSNPTKENWTYNESQHTTGGRGYTIAKDTTVVVASTETPAWITNVENPMLFIPQTLTAWKTAVGAPITKKDADSDNTQSYLVINCKIEQSGSTLYDGTLYIPFGAEWQPGKRYIYTLIFGGGYDDKGLPILTPITFEPTVEDWVDASGYNVQL